jgi:hypothetical protein
MSKRSIQIQETLYCDIDVSAKSLTVAIGRLDSQLGKPICFGFACHQLPHRDVFDEEQVQVARKEDVLNSLSQIAGKYRTVLENRWSRSRSTILCSRAATPSLEALKAYSTGWKTLSSTGPAAALPLFQRATEIDSEFARAHAMLGRAYGGMGRNNPLCEEYKQGLRIAGTRERSRKILYRYFLRHGGNG